MAIEIDALIIFADRDNVATSNAEVGWVLQFKKFLEVMLTQLLGEKPNILLKGEYDTMTSPKLDNVAVLIPILSKDFIQSQRCLENLDSFHKKIESSPDSSKRILKVYKAPLSLQEQPAQLRELPEYRMYQLDPDSGEIREYIDYFGADAGRQYWMELIDISYGIREVLATIKHGTATLPVKNIYNRKTIYLAETGDDLTVQRNIISRELQRLGYAVLPIHPLPGDLTNLERVVRKYLSVSDVSIHLIGSAFGKIADGTDRSVLEIQDKLAVEKSVDAKLKLENFSRLIWISPKLSNASDRQKKFIETLKRDAEVQEGTEILQTLLEDFKSIIREELEDASEKKILEETGGRAIYLMHDRIDHNAVKPFIELIEKAGFNILMPAFDGQLLDLRHRHVENLRNLDAAIIFKGKVNEQWVRMKALELLKAPGFGRKKPIIAKAIVTATGLIADKEPFKDLDLRVIDGDQQQSLNALRSFLQEFES